MTTPPALYITGLGHQYPPYLMTPDQFDQLAARFHDTERPGLKKLIQINHTTGIESRASILPYTNGFATQSIPPTITEIDHFFRTAGVDLAVSACKRALRDARTPPTKITHSVAVTATNQGCPGYDLLVAKKLGLRLSSSPAGPALDRTLLSGVGCAGGLSVLRAAAQLACGASMRGKPARILAFACELCMPNGRHDLAEVAREGDPEGISIVAALFSDAAGAVVLCNEVALAEDREGSGNGEGGSEDDDDDDDDDEGVRPVYRLLEWGHDVIPDTIEHMGFSTEGDGYHTTLTRAVPDHVKHAIGPLFETLLPYYQQHVQAEQQLTIHDFDFALHPGGEAIIDGAKEVLGLTEDQIQATRETYRTRGNSSSPTVLILLDKLRSVANRKRENVVATSFGPGMTIEMALLRRCEVDGE
ncbi:chalcone synthase B [Aspergillus pseudodeflectus]|uniref:Chalcone synthase B n=1 Tax=Aspergillus pseudodeflectus TaxID=176178 RepID=A0ABR4JFY1_9EURO